ncbi:hypothetical protein [Thiobacillus denitrificans]|uniref:hypothetical protein n=1 Tax=Thiobacillus denitrificans TaxID=36861 RepID=UPI00036311AD|nr:hypothetical protein [Thiobacillus denitrificans]
MAEPIVVRTHLDLVDGLSLESKSLKAGLGLLYAALAFDRRSEASVSEAQNHLYFIAGALSDLQKRLESLGADAEALLNAEKLAA